MSRLLLAASAAAGAVICCAGPALHPEPGIVAAFQGDAGRVIGLQDGGVEPLSGEWQLLHRFDYSQMESYSFLPLSPEAHSLLVSRSFNNASAYVHLVLEIETRNGARTTQEVFRHESRHRFMLLYLPDGTFFVSRVVNRPKDYSKTFWVDRDGTAYPVVNCMWNHDFSRPAQLQDGRYQSLFTLPCNTWEAYPGQEPCDPSSTAVLRTKAGQPPEVSCAEATTWAASPRDWEVTRDGRVAAGFYGRTYQELRFDADGGYRGYLRWLPDEVNAKDSWGLIPLGDGGLGILASLTIGTAERKTYLVSRDDSVLDGGLRFEAQPQLDGRDFPNSGPNAEILELQGLWFYNHYNQPEILILDPASLKMVARVPLRRFPDTEGTWSFTPDLHTDGTRIYMIARVAARDGGMSEFWARIATELDPYLNLDGGAPLP